MVQMAGVVIFALGLPTMFQSLDEGDSVDNGVMVAGYVVMRVAMLPSGCARPARTRSAGRALDLRRRIAVAQIGWIALASRTRRWLALFLWVVAAVVSRSPARNRRAPQGGTPWHPHHIAERYGLLAIIALGEGIIGTVASWPPGRARGPGVDDRRRAGRVAGVGLTFGLWWTYFVVPSGEILARAPRRSFGWGYGKIVILSAVAATVPDCTSPPTTSRGNRSSAPTGYGAVRGGPGRRVRAGPRRALHVSHDSPFDRFHFLLILAVTAVLLVVPVLLADCRLWVAWCLLILASRAVGDGRRLRAARVTSTTPACSRRCVRAPSSSRLPPGSAARRG